MVTLNKLCDECIFGYSRQNFFYQLLIVRKYIFVRRRRLWNPIICEKFGILKIVVWVKVVKLEKYKIFEKYTNICNAGCVSGHS